MAFNTNTNIDLNRVGEKVMKIEEKNSLNLALCKLLTVHENLYCHPKDGI